MSAPDSWEDDLVDPFLVDVEDADVATLVAALGSETEAPAGSVKDAILGKLMVTGRFDRFIDRVAQMLDTNVAAAKEMLDRIHEDETWHVGLLPDVHLYDVEGGPKVAGAITGFIRMPQGTPFPEHEHMGDERALIIQGSAIDNEGALWRVGDIIDMSVGTDHSFEARPGPDLLYLVVLQTGLKIGDREFLLGDPNI